MLSYRSSICARVGSWREGLRLRLEAETGASEREVLVPAPSREEPLSTLVRLDPPATGWRPGAYRVRLLLGSEELHAWGLSLGEIEEPGSLEIQPENDDA